MNGITDANGNPVFTIKRGFVIEVLDNGQFKVDTIKLNPHEVIGLIEIVKANFLADVVKK